MKIAFINDSCERLGIGYLSAVLKNNGHQVRLFADPQLFDDENLSFKKLNRLFDYKHSLVSELKLFNPDLVGFSVVTDFYQWACELAKMIKKEINVPIIFGGIHPTSVPERVLQNEFVDMVCIGEGEHALVELVNSMDKGAVDYTIKNIWFRKNNKIIRNDLRPLIEDLDSLPIADKEVFYKASPHFAQCYYIMASRGCLNSCSYCCHSYLKKLYENKGRYLRFRSVANVLKELSNTKEKYNLQMVRFHDDDFMASSIVWLKEFAIRYAREICVPFACFVHPNTVTEEKAMLLKAAGCHDVEIGVQSVLERTRCELMNRKVPQVRLVNAIRILKKAGLKIITDNIIGFPGQSTDEIVDLLKFYNYNRVMKIYCFGFRYYPKTNIIEKLRASGYLKRQYISDLEEGINVEAFISGGDSLNKEMKKIQTFFSFLLYLPRAANDFIIKKKLYRFLPCFPYFINVIFSNWLRIPYKYNWALHITICRYRHFIFKKARHFLLVIKEQTIGRWRDAKKIQPVSMEKYSESGICK